MGNPNSKSSFKNNSLSNEINFVNSGYVMLKLKGNGEEKWA